MRTTPTVLLALALAGCATMSDALPPDTNRMKPDQAPTPYTAEQIRRACPPGRASTYRMESPGHPVFLQTFLFFAGDEEGADFALIRKTETGAPLGEPQRTRNTWEGFRAHASWPAAGTTITNERIETPAGAFDCWLYTNRGEEDGKPTVTRAWFAKDLPGPPVRMTTEVAGKPALDMTLVEHEPGG